MRDTFLSKDTKAQVHKDVRPIHSDYEEIEKVGWTDEARAAAAANRKGRGKMNDLNNAASRWGWGMSHIEQDTKGNLTRHYANPGDDRQRLSVQPNGKWQHTTNGYPTASGNDAPSLGAHLASFHGDPSGQTAHDEMLATAKPNRKLSVPERHQHTIARQTLRMSPAMAGVMGGPNHQESRAILSRNTGLPAHPEPVVGPAQYPAAAPGYTPTAADYERRTAKSVGDTDVIVEEAGDRNSDFKPLAEDAPIQIGGPSVPRTLSPFVGPKVVDFDGDQDSIAEETTYSPAGVHIPGAVPGKSAGKDLFSPVGKTFDPTGMLSSGTGLPRKKAEVPPGIISGDPVLHDDEDKKKAGGKG
jgi:hypothetical protein